MPSSTITLVNEILFYQTDDGKTCIEVYLEDETVWLNQLQMAELFQTTKQNISLHIKNLFQERELIKESVVKKSLTTASDGKKYKTIYYNLDVIISVGYRVKTHRGTQFRLWATQRLKEYLIKGFLLDDERLKKAGNSNYFEELLARIRDIRSSEKVFWRKVLDIYATSIDYAPDAKATKQFFRVVQNKMHWATHGQTAAEIISARANAAKPNMGLTSWSGNKLSVADVEVAKNYLNQEELDVLNRFVSMYLDYAELQAMSRKPMYMTDWIKKLDDFLCFNERELLQHAGKVTHQEAIEKAHAEYEKYRALLPDEPSPIERHFIKALEEVNQLITKK